MSVGLESSDRDPHSAELFGISFSVKKGEAYYVPVVQSDLKELDRAVVLSTLKKVLEGPVKVVGHNLKYDYVLLRKIGIRIAHFHFDTMLAAHDCFGDWEFLNLPFLAKKLLGKEIPSYKEVVGGKQSILDVPFSDLVMHACADADMTFRLYCLLTDELDRRGIADQYRNETLALACRLGEWELAGIPISRAKLSGARAALRRDTAALKELVLDEAGVAFNVDSERDSYSTVAQPCGASRRSLQTGLIAPLTLSYDSV